MMAVHGASGGCGGRVTGLFPAPRHISQSHLQLLSVFILWFACPAASPVYLTRSSGSGRYRGASRVIATAVLLVLVVTIVLKASSRDPEQMETIRQQMVERSARVERACQQHSNTLLRQYSSWLGMAAEWPAVNRSLVTNPELLVDRSHQLIMCKVPKVASTSLVHGLLRLLGRSDLIGSQARGHLHLSIRNMLPRPSPHEDLSSFTAFMVVRHPFQRILSAYRDKLLNRWESYQFRKFQNNYGKAIIHNHRRHPQSRQYRDVPTFGEFVDYLIATPVWEYNEHWLPYYMTCTPCHQRYNIIMHLDSILEEGKYLVHVTGLQELFPEHAHATVNISYSNPENKSGKLVLSDYQVQFLQRRIKTNGTESTTESKYFSELSMHQLIKLYWAYKIDFDMFNFDISPYDGYVKRQ